MCERIYKAQDEVQMSLKTALQTLNLLRPGGGGHVIDLKSNPRAIGMMGLAPFEVEVGAAEACRQVVDAYLADYPEDQRDRISTQLWEDFDDIQRFKGGQIDLSFLDEEFSK